MSEGGKRPASPRWRRTRRLVPVVFLAAALGAAGRLLPWIPWPFELLVHWTPVHGVLLLLAAAILARRRAWKRALAALLLALSAADSVRPLVLGTSRAVPPGAEIPAELLLANALSLTTHTEDLVAQLRSAPPDLLVVLELSPSWHEALLATRAFLPHAAEEVREDFYGLGIYSRWPLATRHAGPLGAGGYTYVEVLVQHPEAPFVLAGAHPRAPALPQGWWGRDDYLRRVADRLRAIEGPRVLAIDANATPWSPIQRELVARSGLLQARLGRGYLGSWPTFLPPFLRIPIDHVLHGDEIGVESLALTEPYGSDHLGLRAALRLPRSARATPAR